MIKQMKEIILEGRDANQILEIVRSLRNSGCVQGVDFDFSYGQKRWDEMVGDLPGQTRFKFYTDKWATWFSLRWL